MRPIKKKKHINPRYFLHEDSLDDRIERNKYGRRGLGDPFGHGTTGKLNIPKEGVIDMRTVETSSMDHADQKKPAQLIYDGILIPCTSSIDCRKKRALYEQLEN